MTLSIDLDIIEETAKLLYIRALKILPDDIKLGFAKLTQSESDGTARTILATMRENIAVRRAHRQSALPGHRHPDLQRRHRPPCRARRRRAQGGDPPRLRAGDQGASAALLDRSPDHAPERADFLRPAGAGHQSRFRRQRGDAAPRD